MGKHNDKYDVIELGKEEFMMVPLSKMMDKNKGDKKLDDQCKKDFDMKKEKKKQKDMYNMCPMDNDFFKEGMYVNPYLLNMMYMNSCLMMSMMNSGSQFPMNPFMNFNMNKIEERDFEDLFGEGVIEEDYEIVEEDIRDHHEEKHKCELRHIVKRIECNHPDIIRTMLRYGMPAGIVRNEIMKIVKVAMEECKCRE